MGADATVKAEPVLPLRATVSAPADPMTEPSSPPAVPRADPRRDFALERRVAALEARLEEQEAAVRRVLTLLVDWVENDEAPSYRHHAA
jgi:hypothetical protein